MELEPSHRQRKQLESLRERGGRSAVATVLEFRRRWGFHESASGGTGGGAVEHYTLRIRVEPDGEEPFEAELAERDFFAYAGEEPKAGSRLAVLYDPADHSDVVRDTSPDAPSVAPPRPSTPEPMLLAVSPPAADPPPGPRDAIAQLRDLAELHDRGAVTDAEFEAEKAKLLGDG